jgi:hypothetical protein
MTIDRRTFLGTTLAGAAGLPLHATAATATMKHGWNVNSPSYYDGGSLYINRLLDAAVSGDTTPTGYPPGGGGKSSVYLVISENAYEWWSYKPGVYRIKGTGTGARVQVGGAGFKEQVVATSEGVPFRISVTLPLLAAPSGEAALTFTRVQRRLADDRPRGVPCG